jgi:ribosomal protein L14E/L6E/L27E
MQDLVGTFVISKSGRDAGKCYVIINYHNEYVYLVDGKIRTLDYPKKKNLKHVNRLKYFDQNLAEAIKNKTVRNEEIKRAIKMLQVEISEKEDE